MNKHIYQELVIYIENKINNEFWCFGDKLPSIRVLANTHSMSKNTVIRALVELEAKLIIEARPKIGYFVCYKPQKHKIPQQFYPKLAPLEVTVPELFYDIMQRSAAFDILPMSDPRPASQHLIELSRHLGRALRHDIQNKSMYYDSPLGLEALRTQIKERYRIRNLHLSIDDLCITSGCQHSLFLALLVTCNPGDNVAVESPAFYGVLQLLEQLKLNIIEISASPISGLDVNELAKALEHWQIKACVVTPAFATPSGATMPADSRQALINLANQYDFAVIEDDIYGELSFDQPISAIKSLDTENRVIMCSSFSKSLARDLRIGWIAAGKWQHEVVRLKLTSQLASCKTQQQGIASFMACGAFRRHIDYFNLTLAHQRNQLVKAIKTHWPQGVRFIIPNGGMALWVELDTNIDTAKLYYDCLEDNIVITPGRLFSSSDYYRNFIRLSFNHAIVGKREAAIKQLGLQLKSPAKSN